MKFFSDYNWLASSVAQVQSFLNDNRRVTTEATDASFAAAIRAVDGLLAQTRVQNASWSTLTAAIASAEHGVAAAKQNIDTDVAAYTKAAAEVAGLRSEYTQAVQTASDARVTDATVSCSRVPRVRRLNRFARVLDPRWFEARVGLVRCALRQRCGCDQVGSRACQL